MSPAVSWLITVKNGMPFLPETLASILAQTFTDHEVLVWLVESDDGTGEELARWIPARLPGKIFRSGPLGLGAARRELVDRAAGLFCACIDADDVNEPNRLERQISFLNSHPEIALVGSRLRLIDEDSRLTGATFDYPLDHVDIVNGLLVQNRIGHSAVVFRRAAVLAAGNYNPAAAIEDYDLWLRLAPHDRLANLPEYLVRYRVQSRSHSHRLGFSRVDQLAAQTLANNAWPLFGLRPESALRLRMRQTPCALWSALKIARHIARMRDVSPWSCLRSPTFLESLRALTSKRDFFSSFSFDLLDPRPLIFRESLHRLRNRVISHMPFGSRVREAVRTRRRSAGSIATPMDDRRKL